MCDQLYTPTATLWERSLGTHRKEGWVGPEAGLDGFEKRYVLALAGIELRFLGRLPRNCIPPSPASVQTRICTCVQSLTVSVRRAVFGKFILMCT